MTRIPPRPALTLRSRSTGRAARRRRQAGAMAACRRRHPVYSWPQWCRPAALPPRLPSGGRSAEGAAAFGAGALVGLACEGGGAGRAQRESRRPHFSVSRCAASGGHAHGAVGRLTAREGSDGARRPGLAWSAGRSPRLTLRNLRRQPNWAICARRGPGKTATTDLRIVGRRYTVAFLQLDHIP